MESEKNNIKILVQTDTGRKKTIIHIVFFDRDVNIALECMMRSTNLTCSDPFASYARPIFHFVEYDLGHGCSGDNKIYVFAISLSRTNLIICNLYVYIYLLDFPSSETKILATVICLST